MTLGIWEAVEVKSTAQLSCERPSCIMFYASDDCLLCDGAWHVLLEVVADLGLADSIVEKVDVNECSPEKLPPSECSMLPIIRICDTILGGFPDVDTVRTRIMQAMMKGCFSIVHVTPTY
ncbi:MAG: hypothetical protein GF309_03755 [Candidatus Lokiarchaeota archaeon]|nr:hypothetical protein [Candidatus Lokiarchaeota archaeon]